MSNEFTDLLRRARGYTGQIAHVEQLPPRTASYGEPRLPLPPALATALAKRGIHQLYRHQAEAIDAARAGDHLGVVTATASGKTLCYQIPAVETILADPSSRALLLFPTKALAADQLRALQRLLDDLPGDTPIAATLDGDTPMQQRDTIRARAQIILSNPDLLHRTLLPDHRRWQRFFANLRFVVLDEAHTYRGVFGTHVALIVRRLRRICAHYGASPQFICCSATSANPSEHLAALVGDAVQVIDGDGAPHGPRTFVLWNPPVVEARSQAAKGASDGGRRRSTNAETAGLLSTLVASGIKTLAFTRTRRGAELVLRYARDGLDQSARQPGEQARGAIAAYRAGYTIAERRAIEHAFLTGELAGLVSTNALELGVDIGGVDAVIIGGFPGTVASAWQQAGRAGRAQGASLALLVAQDDPLDQFYMRHPREFFGRPVEHARVALDNPYILSDQLRCAAFELPLHDADALWFGPTYPALRDWLLRRGAVGLLPDGRLELLADRPAAGVNIRSADGEGVELRDTGSGRTIEQLSASRAPFEAYPGAIYLNQGETYLITSLAPRLAECRRVDVDYYTQTIEETEVAILATLAERQAGGVTLSVGKVEVTRRVTGYKRKQQRGEHVLSEHELTLPPQTFRTIAVWWTVPQTICQQTEDHCDELVDALHAMEHSCIGLLPIFAQCDRADIGGLSTDRHPGTGMPTIFVYDGVPGGVGIAQTGYDQAEAWWAQTRALLVECSCIDGCPACVQSPKCGNGNQHLSKTGAAALASLLTGAPIPSRTMPSQRPAGAPPPESLIADLQGRLDRAKSETSAPRRGALVAALRYRIAIEKSNPASATLLPAIAAIEADLGRVSLI